ncbi:MAG: hypothetical protein MI924_06205 [Chloroflexales bacterium]|nr:hypothetical protein [Chloroflexales bacterium]
MPEASWRFPERLVSRGTKLLTQQCWYWGCDVRRPEGNLLMEYGFTRTRPPKGVEGSTMYMLEPAPGAQVILWSFGVFFGREGLGGLFLDRFRCEPLLTDRATLAPEIWRTEQLPAQGRAGDADRARVAALLGDLLRRVIAYEHTVLAAQGLAYREACLARWSRRKLGLPADALVPAWQTLAKEIHANCMSAAHTMKGS